MSKASETNHHRWILRKCVKFKGYYRDFGQNFIKIHSLIIALSNKKISPTSLLKDFFYLKSTPYNLRLNATNLIDVFF